jgi:hypothetical protein
VLISSHITQAAVVKLHLIPLCGNYNTPPYSSDAFHICGTPESKTRRRRFLLLLVNAEER